MLSVIRLLLAGVLVLFLLITVSPVPRLTAVPTPKLYVYFIDVGQGDAILV